MLQRSPSREPAEPTEVLTALLVGRGLAWPLARGLAPWVQVIGSVRQGEMILLLEATRVSVTVLLGWLDDTEAVLADLHSACAASLALVDALDEQDGLLVEKRRASAWAALRILAGGLRAAQPSLWAKQRGLSW